MLCRRTLSDQRVGQMRQTGSRQIGRKKPESTKENYGRPCSKPSTFQTESQFAQFLGIQVANDSSAGIRYGRQTVHLGFLVEIFQQKWDWEVKTF